MWSADSSQKHTATVFVDAFAAQWFFRARHGSATRAAKPGSLYALSASEDLNARLLWVSPRAAAYGVGVGISAKKARALLDGLQVYVLRPEELARAQEDVTRVLLEASPTVECAYEQGVFFLDASGLRGVFLSPEIWCQYIGERLSELGLDACVAVGVSRYGSYAAAKTLRRIRSQNRKAQPYVVLASHAEEFAYGKHLPLAELMWTAEGNGDASATLASAAALHSKMRDVGIHTLADFADLTRADLLARFPQARGYAAWVDWATSAVRGTLPFDVLRPTQLPLAYAFRLDFDEPEMAVERLMFGLKPRIESACTFFREQSRAVVEMRVRLRTLLGAWNEEVVRPTEPASYALVLVQLLRLQLEANVYESNAPSWQAQGYTELEVSFTSVRYQKPQTKLIAVLSDWNEDAVARAVDRVCARFGAQSVMVAELHAGHLPEAQYRYKPWKAGVATGVPRSKPVKDLVCDVRRLQKPVPFRLQFFGESTVRIGSSVVDASGRTWSVVGGPYRKRGAWWSRTIERDYFILEDATAETLWVFFDRQRQRWMLQGRVA